jgi:hypothetical protein
MLLFFDSMRRTLSGGKYPTTRRAIYASEKHENWTSNTLIRWLREVALAMRERPLKGCSSTSHSLRKEAATFAYNVGVTLQNIKYFGGWSTESSVVLDYIDSTVLERRSKWFFFGWLAPWCGG